MFSIGDQGNTGRVSPHNPLLLLFCPWMPLFLLHSLHVYLYLCISILHLFLLLLPRLHMLRWARAGERFGPAAEVHPAGVGQPAHLPLAHLRRRDLHLHGEQLQGHRRGVGWPRGLGWARRFRRTRWTAFLKTRLSSTCVVNVRAIRLRGWEVMLCRMTIKKSWINSFRHKSSVVCKSEVITEVFSVRKNHQEYKIQNSSMSFQLKWVFLKFVCLVFSSSFLLRKIISWAVISSVTFPLSFRLGSSHADHHPPTGPERHQGN